MKLLDYLKIIYHCFFSRKLYRYVFSSWKGNILLYLLISSFLIAIIPAYSFVAVQFKIDVREIAAEKPSDSFNANIATIIEQLPELVFYEGQVSFKDSNNQQAVIIRDKEGQEIITIDPEDQIKSSTTHGKKMSKYIFHKKYIEIFNEDGQINTMYYDSFFSPSEKININKEYILNALSMIESYRLLFLVIITLVGATFLIFNACFYAVFYSLVIILLRYRSKLSTTILPMIRVMIVASTPTSILKGLEVVLVNNILLTAAIINLISVLVSISSILYAIYATQSLTTLNKINHSE
jgi:hypothetical protein